MRSLSYIYFVSFKAKGSNYHSFVYLEADDFVDTEGNIFVVINSIQLYAIY